MRTVRETVYAKLNLTLDIVGRTGEYHEIDSLAVTVDLADTVTAKKRRDGLIRVTMRGMGSESIPTEENNAVRAGEAFVAAFGTQGADISIDKNIPMGAGLGGSSADAAGVLNALKRLYEIGEDAAPLADGIGSDVRYLLRGGFARMRGRGERVEPLGELPELHFVLLVPKKGVGTRECYRMSDELPPVAPCTERALQELMAGNVEWAAKLFHNALCPAAAKIAPEVEEGLAALKALSPWGASMTGSGSGVFAVFETRELCEWAKSRLSGPYRAYVLKTAERRSKEDGRFFAE